MRRANEGVKRYWNAQEAASIDRNAPCTSDCQASAPRQTAVPALGADIHRVAVKAEKIETTKSPIGRWAEFSHNRLHVNCIVRASASRQQAPNPWLATSHRTRPHNTHDIGP